MFVFGVCIDRPQVFDRHCLPAIAAFGGVDATLITSSDKPLPATYNKMLDASLDMTGVEAIVLLSEDVEITDPGFRAKVRAAFAADPDLAVLGPVGGPVSSGACRRSGGAAGVPVDFVDGRCLVLRPDVAARVRFDESSLAGSRGYDVDFCARVRDAGLTVAVEPLAITRHGGHEADDGGVHRLAAVRQGRRAAQLGRSTPSRLPRREPHAETWPVTFDFVRPEVLTQLPAGVRRVLDVGCGSGTLGAAIKDASGAAVVGIEPGEQAAALAETRLDAVLRLPLDAPHRPTGMELVDVVVAAAVLERCADAEETLRALVAWLGPQGCLIATFPNVGHWSVVLPLLLQDRWEYQPGSLLDPASRRFFTLAEAAELLRGAGLGDLQVCASEQIPLTEPRQLDGLLECLTDYGLDSEEARTRLDSYRYLVVARR